MNDRPITLSLALPLMLLAAAVCVPSAPAQRGGFASRGGMAVRGGGVRAGSIRPRGTGGYYGGSGYSPLFYPDYDTGYAYSPALPPPPPQWVSFAPAAPAPPPKPAEAMVLEREGDQWVRITPYGSTSNEPRQTDSTAGAPSSPPASSARAGTPAPARVQATASATPAAPLPPAVLVFRDGHQEQIGQYRIMGASIYVNTDYWSSGAWTRTIPLADLDVPATLKLNQQRGANFRLPSSPDEVMIGG